MHKDLERLTSGGKTERKQDFPGAGDNVIRPYPTELKGRKHEIKRFLSFLFLKTILPGLLISSWSNNSVLSRNEMHFSLDLRFLPVG